MTGRVVMIDGVLFAPDAARVSVYDRGFLFGDAVFEVFRTYGGKPFALDEHLARLRRSAESVFIDLPTDETTLTTEVASALAAAGNAESYVRLMITRGVGPVSLDPSTAVRPSRILLVEPLAPPPRAAYVDGIAVALLSTRRAVDDTAAMGAKVTNYLANLLALREAKARGSQEALVVDAVGHVVEGASSNVFVVRAGELATPSLLAGILAGITRARVLAAAPGLALCVVERDLRPEDLFDADEVFVTSSIREVLPVVRVDGCPIGSGVPGPVAKALHRRFRERVAAELGISVGVMPYDDGAPAADEPTAFGGRPALGPS